MLISSLFFILQTAAQLLGGVFLLRFLMQWARVPFRNPIGQFVIAASDWAVLPLRRVVPGLWGVDMSSLLLAWLVQYVYYMLAFALSSIGGFEALVTPAVIGTVALAALVETARLFLYLIFGIVILTAIMSWVNPYAPMAPVLNALARPFLAPFQRIIPSIGGVDLSPIALIIVLQLLLGLLSGLRYSFFAHG
ncbi:MAG TPA: YggT family protein [Roseateles sp.]|nr:YggT family protein [Roseateles sp.]HWT53565.1 YggT family protein [Rhodocyclaceae bacterium]